MRPSRKHQNQSRLIATTVLFLSVLVASCDSDETTGPSASGDSYRVSTFVSDVTSLAPGESTIVRATVVGADGKSTQANREVLFGEMLNKRSGSYAKTSMTTDESGVASTVYRADAGVVGEVTLKATAGGESKYCTVNLVAAPVNGLHIVISSPTEATAIPADGIATLPLRVTATNGESQVPVSGLEIVLTAGDRFIDTNGDGVRSEGEGVDPSGDSNGNGEWDALGSVPATVVTNSSGVADFLLESETVTGTTWVRATADGSMGELAVQFHPTTLQISVQPAVSEMIADGISTTQVYATVSDWGGSSTAGVIVRFVAGEPFVDVGGDGEYTPNVDSYTDRNGNGKWDVIGAITSIGTTGEDGTVSVTYRAGLEPSEVRIRATVTGGSAEGTIHLVPVPSAGQMEAALDRSRVYADGRSPIEGELTVYDLNGSPLAGKQVTLVAGEPFDDLDGDGLFTEGTDQLLVDLNGDDEWTAIGEVDPVCITGAGGIGTFSYEAGLVVGRIMIKATVDQVSIDIPVDLQDLPPVTEVVLNRERAEIQVLDGGGIDNVLLSALCYDALGDTVPAGVPVLFEIIAGPTDGGQQLVDEVDGVYETRTEADGYARAVLVAGTKPGIVKVRATVESVVRTIEVGIVAGTANQILLHADDDILTFWAQTTICAFVLDVWGNPVRNGTIVVFRVDEGMIEGTDGLGTSQTSHGQACATFYSLGPAIDTDFIAVITAEVQGTTTSASLDIQLEETPPPPINEIELSADRTSVNVRRTGPVDTVKIIARGFTIDGLPVGAGYPIDFWIESGPMGGENLDGVLEGVVQGHTNQDGIAQVILEPGTLPGPVQIRSHSGTANIVGVEVQIVAGPPVDIDCSATPDEIGSEESCEVHAYVYDEYHNPVQDGVLISFQVDEGMVVGEDGPGSSRTENGIATATYFSLTPDPNGDGVATITCIAEGGELSCQTNVRIPVQETGLETLSLTTADETMMVSGAGGIDETTLQIVAYNPSGQAVGEGYDIRFEVISSPGGGETLDGVIGGPTTASTNGQGRASITLASGTNAGRMTIAARYGQIWSNELLIQIQPGPAVEIACWPGAAQVADDDSTTIFVRVRDLHRNPVKDSTKVSFDVDEGWVNGDAYTGASYSVTIGGYAHGLYHSPEEVPGGDGWADVTCSVQDGPVCETRVGIPSSATEPYSVQLTAAADEIGVNGSGSVENTDMVATPKNGQGGIIGSGVEVLFEIVGGPSGALIDGDPASSIVLTRNDGRAHAELTSGTESGIAIVRATAGNVYSEYTVAIAAGPPAYVECTTPDSVACDVILWAGEVRASVYDIHHNPVRDGTPVWFTADAGLITGNFGEGAVSETEYGVVYAWYFAPLASECEDWTQATLGFHAADKTCTRIIYKK